MAHAGQKGLCVAEVGRTYLLTLVERSAHMLINIVNNEITWAIFRQCADSGISDQNEASCVSLSSQSSGFPRSHVHM